MGRPRKDDNDAEIGHLLRKGLSTREISRRLSAAGYAISPRTVQRRYHRIVCALVTAGWSDDEICASLKRSQREIAAIISEYQPPRPPLRFHDSCGRFYPSTQSCPVCGQR